MEQMKKESISQSIESNKSNLSFSYEVTSVKKKILSYLLDFFMIVVFTTIINIFSNNFITNNLPNVKENSALFYESYEENESVIEASHLSNFNNESYLMMLVKSSLSEDNFPGTDFFKVINLTKENDAIYLYYHDYKLNNLDIYLNSANFDPDSYITSFINSDYFTFDNSYYLLKEDVALKIGDNIFNKTNSNEELKEDVLELIQKTFNEASNDLITNNITYINSLKNLENYANIGKNYNLITLSVSYLISYFLYFVLLPLCLKSKKTISMIVFKSSYEFKNKSKIISSTSLNLIRVVIFYSTILFSGYLSLGNSMSLILFNEINNVYYLLFILLFTVLLYIFSLLLCLIKPLNQTFEEKISKAILLDETKVIIDDRKSDSL